MKREREIKKMRQRKSQTRGARRVVLCGVGLLAVLTLAVFSIQRGAAQSGVLIHSNADAPDASKLSLAVMNVDVTVDNQLARVQIEQIFDNHTDQILEGKYLFALLPQASISDFAVWDDDTRIPGVIVEKRRAEEVYAELKNQAIDPGLLKQEDEHEGGAAFSAQVVPIPAFGTKRIELEYTEMLPVESLTSHFSLPLRAAYGEPQRAAEFNLRVRVTGDYPISPLQFAAKTFPMQLTKQDERERAAEFHARDIALAEDFSFDYRINISEDALAFITHRAPERITAYDLRDPVQAATNPDGYFEARAIFNRSHSAANSAANHAAGKTRNVVVLFDTSLSMHGEKLARAFEAVDYFLNNLNAQDTFNLILFNEDVNVLANAPLAATHENAAQALDFIKNSTLGGGTDLRKALLKGIELADALPANGERAIILISDANSTIGTTDTKKIASVFNQQNNEANAIAPVKLFAFALGIDANRLLLRELAERTHGYFTQARETEEISTQLKLFFDKIGGDSIENIKLRGEAENFYQVYQDATHSFDGSSVAFVGRYKNPTPRARVSVQGQSGTQVFDLTRDAQLPELDEAHDYLPRVWARARVDALLQEMNLNGERADYISEIIRLSQKYKFVTPYTAFVAAPRALLRPRLIQPGDPVIRVKTDASIKSVFAVLPFGETLPLKFLAREKVWEARFFAPAWMPDGTYRCRLLLTDKNGNAYQEEKSFVVDSHAPRLRVSLAQQTVNAGDEIVVRVLADKDTARIVAKMYGAAPVPLFWSSSERANIGRLRVPAGLAAGMYTVTVSAEDFAHNQSSADAQVQIIAR
jgi:Ca-activated chloride channel family protein